MRAEASFAGRSVGVDDGSDSQNVGNFSLVVDMNATPPYGYASLSGVSLDTSAAAQSWAFISHDWTVVIDAETLQSASNSGQVLWLNLQPSSPATLELLIPGDRSTHAFALVQNGSNVVSLGDWFDSNWLRGSASFDPSLPFYVEDLTTGERSSGSTLLLNWFTPPPPPPPPVLESISFILDEGETGSRFTLHYQLPGLSEMVQSIVAVSNSASGSQQMSDGSYVDVTNSAIVTGSAALGSTFWLTRDADDWNTQNPSTYYLPDGSYTPPLQWSLRGVLPPPPLPGQTISFYIATGFGSSASVHQPSGDRGLTYVGDGVVPDLDANGNPHDFYYEEFTAEIDPSEPFWLHVNGIELSQGETWYYNGWEAINGPQDNMQDIPFYIATSVSIASVVQSGATQYLSDTGEFGWIEDYDAEGNDHYFNYEVHIGYLDANLPFTLQINGVLQPEGETWYYDGWTPLGGGAPPWGTLYFQIAAGYGNQASLTQNGSAVTLDGIWWTGTIPDLDGDGQDHSFQYEVWSAWLRTDRPFTLAINGSALPENETWFYNGWSPIGGPASLSISFTLHESRTGHTFLLTSPGGGSWEWTPGDWTGTQTLELYDWEWVAFELGVNVFGATGVFYHNRTPGDWSLTDQTTDETVTFNPDGQESVPLNLGHWFAPPSSVGLTISLSRWGHDLRIYQRNRGAYSVEPGSSQGSLILTSAGAWYNPEYTFSATGHRRDVAGLDWWVYDVDTGESSPMNPTDLSGWYCLMPPDEVHTTRTGITTAEVTWQVPGFDDVNWLVQGGFYVERRSGGGAWMQIAALAAEAAEVSGTPGAFYYVDTDLPLGVTYQYRVAYYYGTPRQNSAWCVSNQLLLPSDSDDDGMNDAWEVANGLDPNDPNDAALDKDQDGWSNLAEFLAGLNPSQAPQDDPDGTHVRLVVFTRLE